MFTFDLLDYIILGHVKLEITSRHVIDHIRKFPSNHHIIQGIVTLIWGISLRYCQYQRCIIYILIRATIWNFLKNIKLINVHTITFLWQNVIYLLPTQEICSTWDSNAVSEEHVENYNAAYYIMKNNRGKLKIAKVFAILQQICSKWCHYQHFQLLKHSICVRCGFITLVPIYLSLIHI